MVDFYRPQVLHVHFTESKVLTVASVLHLALFQEVLVAICLRFPRLALKTAWWCLALIEDHREKRTSPSQFAASSSLLLQLDMAMTGSSTVLAELPSVRTFTDCLFVSSHQREELLIELSTLYRTRLRINSVERELIIRRISARGNQEDTTTLQKVEQNSCC